MRSFSQGILEISIANLPHYHIDNLSDEELNEIEFYRYLTIGSDAISVIIVIVFILYWKVLSTKISN